MKLIGGYWSGATDDLNTPRLLEADAPGVKPYGYVTDTPLGSKPETYWVIFGPGAAICTGILDIDCICCPCCY